MKQHGETLDFLHHFESLGIPLIDCMFATANALKMLAEKDGEKEN